MTSTEKHEQNGLLTLVRRRGKPQPPKVDPQNSEIRSCLVAPCPLPVEPEPEGLLGGIVVMWEFSLPYTDVQEFHDFLRASENDIHDSLAAWRLARNHPGGPFYRGT